jgi:hypothetical protein
MRASSVLDDQVAHRVCRPRNPRTTASTCPQPPHRRSAARRTGAARCLQVGEELAEERVVDADVGDADLVAVARAAALLLELMQQILDLEGSVGAEDLHDGEAVLPQALQMLVGGFRVP